MGVHGAEELKVAAIHDATVTVEAHADGPDRAVLVFGGTLGHRDPGPLLRPLFTDVHRTLVETRRREVRIDLRALRFMNSASFKYFVTWIKANGALPPGDRYRIHFLLNPRHHWQAVSIHALRCFSADEITVEQEEPAE
jgi:hypothetical protein